MDRATGISGKYFIWKDFPELLLARTAKLPRCYRKVAESRHSFSRRLAFTLTIHLHITIYGLLAVASVAMATKCGAAEYKTGKECCPMCSPGHYVVRPCTEDISTTCLPCPPSTFTDKHNGLTRCLSCAVCDTSAGLSVKGNCSSSSDTLCEPLEGHYCTDPIKDGCRGAVEHTKCLPGQNIKQPGSASSDTVCGDCGNNTYSDGTFISCRPHTQCGLKGLDVLKEGSSSYDTECGRRHMHIGGVAVLLLLAVGGGVGIFICIHRKKKRNRMV
ncbi:hypothetical protein ACEWY4_000141 [Coilia grayii]|uniref:TNFR-Cys domain-containing protein n=1 Tax=Coilia grayii TaxID=363190 RepID=A0ABD1KVT2_9TELE